MPQIVNYLAYKCTQMPNPGLYHGRMGIILALYGYGVTTKDETITHFASELLQCSSEDTFVGDISVESGITGLGLGYTFLYKLGLFKNDLNEILEEIDQEIMRIDPRRINDNSFRRGRLGILYYIKNRLSTNQELRSINQTYIEELTLLIPNYQAYMASFDSVILDIQEPQCDNVKSFSEIPVGIDNGLSYYLLKSSYENKIFSN